MVRKPLLPIASSVLDTLQLDMATLLQTSLPSHNGLPSSLQTHPGLPDHDRSVPRLQHPHPLNSSNTASKSELICLLPPTLSLYEGSKSYILSLSLCLLPSAIQLDSLFYKD